MKHPLFKLLPIKLPKINCSLLVPILAATSLFITCSASATVITFDENALAPNSYFNPQSNTSFTSGGTQFDQGWNSTFNCCWSNFTYSNSTNTTTPGFANDRSAITGDGSGIGQDNYGVSFGSGAYIDFGKQTKVSSANVTNTTYAYLSILNGDLFAKQFDDNDFFNLIINGLDQNGDIATSTIFQLADGTDIVDDWTNVDLSILGTVYGLSFDYDSSDIGTFGVNTPQYFAIDDIAIQAVSEPATLVLFGLGIAGVLRLRQIKE